MGKRKMARIKADGNKLIECGEEIISLCNKYNNLIEDWFEDTINKDSSIWLGSGVADQVLLNFDGLTEENSRETFDYIGFASQNAVASVIRYVIDKGEDS